MKRIENICIAIATVALILTMVGCPLPMGDIGNEDDVVTLSAIAGVTPPVYGGTPVSLITETDQYTGTVTWSPSDGIFGAAKVYTATITLTAKPGYTLTGVAANSFTVEGASTVANDADSGVVTAIFPATGAVPATVVNIAAISGVTAPVYGRTPVSLITETDQYTGTVSWSPDDDPFASETVYTATITLTAKSGYTLTGVAADSFTVAGADSVTHSADSGVVTAAFPATGAVPATVVNIAAIPGVTMPVLGASPVTSITETDQYTGTVTWSPSDGIFGAAKVYTATITLTAKPGYTLTGIAENSFTVAGADSVTHSADSGVVTAAFPETEAAIVNIAAIPGVTMPVLGASPVTSITETEQYTGTVSWSPDDDPFASETVYTATITLTAKPGYTLTGVAADSFTVAGADSVTHSADSGVVTAAFPETEAAIVNIAAIPGVTMPVLGANPVTSITETEQYTGTVSWDGGWDWSLYFGGGKAYTATITLTVKPGYTLAGVTENFFTVAGAVTVTNNADTGAITALFPATASVSIGDAACGGKVIYILQTGDSGYIADEQRGLIASESDQSSSGIAWALAAYQSTLTDGTGTGIGSGSANTEIIIAQNGAGTGYAAGLARACTDGGYTDWFLPSQSELQILYDNRNSVGSFAAYSYWSSSETGALLAWAKDFAYGLAGNSTNKSRTNCRVRAVRAF